MNLKEKIQSNVVYVIIASIWCGVFWGLVFSSWIVFLIGFLIGLFALEPYDNETNDFTHEGGGM